jgi:hypothetical protein
MKQNEIIKPNELDKQGKAIGKLPCVYDKENLNIGASANIEVATVEVKDAAGNVYGRRSLFQKAR